MLKILVNHLKDCPGKSVNRLTYLLKMRPASVAQFDARPTGDEEIAGLTPVGLATFFCGD